ncbi:lycopene cyclase domain-containing protein [Lacinutrix sp. C3R15]|uniref:lycopene cyclase domain-containing protein n=1 Tax=Flavobacteriaceae TaxID=49546 RepID=UPI001C0887CF|nr:MULTISPECIES: lycopene cyclase domain-containing protein [Flavobacteriaceae]MBU2940026.1 lycopene cyclase domain-containing protein [Lacinutrix sp. C3R15]MDO6623343.1 lycopene cyclase domain-containing protein [Oceanihabitans sp. 1_MG-2023]
MQPYTYLLIDFACISIPFLASFYKKHAFYKEWLPFFKANIIIALLFIVWDSIFTNIGVWGFNTDYLTGFHIGNLPIEEILFFICIPYCCVFTFFALKHIIKKNPLEKTASALSYLCILVFGIVGLLHTEKLYTSITLLSTSIFLIYLKVKKVNLSYHYLTFFLILPFFCISNGILTGSFLVKKPIVWYNNAENLGVRISNIPIEDSIYGMLLIFMNIELYRYFKNKKTIYK